MTCNGFLNVSDSNVVNDNNHMSELVCGLCYRNKTINKEYNKKCSICR